MKSYQDCQESAKLQQCYNTYPCVQIYKVFDNGSLRVENFYKGCTLLRACEQVNKGNMTAICPVNAHFPLAVCKAKCCYEDECNKEIILDLDTTGHDSGTSSGKTLTTNSSVQSAIVLGLFLVLLLTVVNANY